MMGKRAALTKTTKYQKKNNQHDDLMRPRVYITDVSSFRRLVQELTGNNGGRSCNNVTVSPPPPPHMQQMIPIMEVEDRGGLDSTDLELKEAVDACQLVRAKEEMNKAYDHGQMHNIGETDFGMGTLYREVNFSTYSDLETWLLSDQ